MESPWQAGVANIFISAWVSWWRLRRENDSLRMAVALEGHLHERKCGVGDYQKLSKFMRMS
jgi:hypothetical protein